MDDYNNYTEQNRQLLQRYTPEQCILLELPEHLFEALQAGEPITLQAYLQGIFWVFLLMILSMLALVFFLGENYGWALVICPTAMIIFGAFSLFLLVDARKFGEKLELFWQHGTLLVSSHVEIDRQIDGDETADNVCGLRYVFETPEGSIAGEKKYYSFDKLSKQAKAKPTMLMLYKSPQEYLIL